MKLRLIACAAMAFARAYAQETPPVVQVKASADLQRQRDTASRSVISREEILRFGDANALDVLKRLPGVSLGEGGPRMRGLGAGYTQILLNGERPPPGFSLENLAPDMIEKIEVVRSATADFSTQAVAGTINIVLRKSAGKASREWRAAATLPGRLPSRNAGLGLADNDQQRSYTLNASVAQGNNHRPEHSDVLWHAADGTLASQRQEDVFSRNRFLFVNVNGRVNWTLSPGHTLAWQNYASAVRFRADRGLDVRLTGGTILPFARSDYQREDQSATLRTEVIWSRSWGEGGRIESTFSLSAGQDQRWRQSSYQAQRGVPSLEREYDVHAGTRRGGWTGKLTLPQANGHAPSLGWDVATSRQREHELQDETAMALGTAAADFDRTSRIGLRSLAAYVQDEWELGQGWSIYAGLRRESSAVRSSGTDLAGATTHAGVTSPILQALWKLPGEQRRQLRMALARTYKAPSSNQLLPRRFRALVNSELAPDASGNASLKPELARGIDLAFEAYGNDGALFSLAAGSRNISDVIFNAVALQDGRWVSAPGNFGRARTHSLELEWKGPIPASPLRFALSAGRHWSHVAGVPGPDNRLARQPRWTANAGAEYRNGPWNAGASFSYSATGWVRITPWQSVYNGVQRDLEAYVSYRNAAGSQWRISSGNLLRHPSQSVNVYADANGRKGDAASTRNGAWLRVGYERKL